MYNLEIQKAIDSMRKNKSKRVLLQLPDGLKPKAKDIQEQLLKETKAEIFIYAGSCFGACDTHLDEAKRLDIDLVIQWGHSEWK